MFMSPEHRQSFRRFRQLAATTIVGTLPYNIINGQVIDAVPVMADLQYIVDQVNSNVPPLVGGGAGSGAVTYVALASVGGTSSAITLTPTPVLNSYAEGNSYLFQAKFTNPGFTGVTINVSGLGAKNLLLANGNGLLGGELQAGGEYLVCYDGTQFKLVNFPAGSGLQSWTPTLSFGGASTGITYSTQGGNLITVGNLVMAWMAIALTSKGTATGAATVALPVPANASIVGAGSAPCGWVNTVNVTYAGQITAGVQPNAATLNLFSIVSGGALTQLTNAAFANNSTLAAFAWYTA